jgi:multidrug efflux pump
MNPSSTFIDRPVATTLLTMGVALAGAIAFKLLPVSPLPQVDYPTISVQASLPGASPETMAATVATSLERSPSHRRRHRNDVVKFAELDPDHIAIRPNRDIDGAARDAGGDQRRAQPVAERAAEQPTIAGQPGRRADHDPGIDLGHDDTGPDNDGTTIIAQKLSQGAAWARSPSAAVATMWWVEINPTILNKYVDRFRGRARACRVNANRPKGSNRGRSALADRRHRSSATAAEYIPLIVSYRNGVAVVDRRR